MVHNVKLLIPLGILLSLVFLLFVRKPWGRTARRMTGSTVLVGFVLAILFLAAAAFVAIPDGSPFGDDAEGVNLTYEQYVSVVGSDGLVPKEASDICFRRHQTIDSYDSWLKLRLPSAAYESLIAKMSTDLQDPHFLSHKENILSPVKKTLSDSANPRSIWPSPEVNPPSWFEAEQMGDQLQCTQWDVQLADRAKGWYWLYDRNLETLRIWEWNRQHFRVR
jgi:hypothetical protein